MKTPRRTRVLFYNNTIIWTLCVHSSSFGVLFLGASEIAATFFMCTGPDWEAALTVCLLTSSSSTVEFKVAFFV